MTTGALIFAFNNEHIDYEAMARWSAKNIKRHLGIETRIITNADVAPQIGGTRLFDDINESVTWYNANRMDAYTLSPWNQTLLLDADYVVASNQLQTLLDSDQDFLAHRCAYDITGKTDFIENNYFGQYRMPMWWATVIMFRRGNVSEQIFGMMRMIRDNWEHYRNLYGITRKTYRNDYALSIALNTVNGHVLDHAAIPWNLSTVTHDHVLRQTAQDQYRVDWLTYDQKPRWITMNQDFHAMGKGHLGDIVANSC
jgi:hypothetical protein